MFTTQSQVRAAFWQGWENRPRPKKLKDGDYPTDVRVEFVEFVDMLSKDGHITEQLARKVTL